MLDAPLPGEKPKPMEAFPLQGAEPDVQAEAEGKAFMAAMAQFQGGGL